MDKVQLATFRGFTDERLTDINETAMVELDRNARIRIPSADGIPTIFAGYLNALLTNVQDSVTIVKEDENTFQFYFGEDCGTERLERGVNDIVQDSDITLTLPEGYLDVDTIEHNEQSESSNQDDGIPVENDTNNIDPSVRSLLDSFMENRKNHHTMDVGILKYAIRKYIAERKINLDNYKHMLSSSKNYDNMVHDLELNTSMSERQFRLWTAILGVDWSLILQPSGKVLPLYERTIVTQADLLKQSVTQEGQLMQQAQSHLDYGVRGVNDQAFLPKGFFPTSDTGPIAVIKPSSTLTSYAGVGSDIDPGFAPIQLENDDDFIVQPVVDFRGTVKNIEILTTVKKEELSKSIQDMISVYGAQYVEGFPEEKRVSIKFVATWRRPISAKKIKPDTK